jgi:hypothetical protein
MSNYNLQRINNIIKNSNSLDSVEADKLNTILNLVEEYFSESFNVSLQNDNIFKYTFNLIDNDLGILIKSIDNMRSSFLPQEIIDSFSYGSLESNSSDSISTSPTILESYQNTFFRMLGLPSLSDVFFENESAKVSIINNNGDILEIDKDYAYSILDNRQNFASVECFDAKFFNILGDEIDSTEDILSNIGFSNEKIIEVKDFSFLLKEYLEGSEDAIVNISNYLNQYKDSIDKIKKEDPDNNLLFQWYDSFMSNNTYDETTLEPIYTSYLNFLVSIQELTFSSTQSFKNFESNLSDSIKTLYNRLVLGILNSDSIDNISKNILRFSSLLFPLVKDDRISKCINNSDKIVSDPFLPITKRQINGNFIKSSLLESIIRIRTDVISGTRSYSGENPYKIGEDNVQISDSISGELMGYLESLLIVKMFQSIESIAESTINNIEQISESQRKHNILFKSKCMKEINTNTGISNNNEEKNNEIDELKKLLLLEDSILLLLGAKDQDEDSLSLQSGINRNSSVPSSHLMPSLVNIVQSQRKYIVKRIDNYKNNKNNNSSAGTSILPNIEKELGIISGIGYIDFVIIITALLTIDEISLISLLTNEQIENMLKQINKDSFDDDKIRKIKEMPIEIALKNLTIRVSSIYKIFIELLEQ